MCIYMYGLTRHGVDKDLWEEDSTEPSIDVRRPPLSRSYNMPLFVAFVLSITFFMVWRSARLEGSEEGGYIRGSHRLGM